MIAQAVLALSLTKPPDHWFGPDKLKHFFLGAFTQSVTYSVLQAGKVRHDRALVAAWGTTAAVSIAKEIRDYRSYGLFSVRDLVWDAAGAGSATLILRRAVRAEAPIDAPAVAISSWSPTVSPLLSDAVRAPILPRPREAPSPFAPRR